MGDLSGWQVLVTAGGTREPIDPVRYIGNRSSGKMGWRIAEVAAARGADVLIVSTVQSPTDSDQAIELIEVETAAEMAEAVWANVAAADVLVMAAAVADFRPRQVSETKLRRAAGPPVLELEPAVDVLAGVAEMEVDTFVVAFAAETGDVELAVDKATAKKVDLTVANDVSSPGSGFATETNEVSLIYPDRRVQAWPMLSKREVAERLWDEIAKMRAPQA